MSLIQSRTISESKQLPPANAEGKEADQKFDDATEKLFRRFSPIDYKDGRVGLDKIRATVHFPKAAEIREDPAAARKSPSWVWSRYGKPEDTIHPACAEGSRADITHYGVMSIEVGDLNKQVKAESGPTFDFHPFHDPLATCYAHALIYSCLTGEVPPKYNPPPKDVVNALRQRIYAQQVIEIEPSNPSEFPLPSHFGYRDARSGGASLTAHNGSTSSAGDVHDPAPAEPPVPE